MPPELLKSHIAWDPGALGVAEALRKKLTSILLSCTVSRLVYDCNRPPDAPSAIPERSEIFDIPGNLDLSAKARAERVQNVYQPFSGAVTDCITRHRGSLELLVTVHSFTPVFHNVPRRVEIGILHGRDSRFADAMMRDANAPRQFEVQLNQPYSAADGVAHTLDLHGLSNGLLNVMIEIRNDLIADPKAQAAMADHLARWIHSTRASMQDAGNPD